MGRWLRKQTYTVLKFGLGGCGKTRSGERSVTEERKVITRDKQESISLLTNPRIFFFCSLTVLWFLKATEMFIRAASLTVFSTLYKPEDSEAGRMRASSRVTKPHPGMTYPPPLAFLLRHAGNLQRKSGKAENWESKGYSLVFLVNTRQCPLGVRSQLQGKLASPRGSHQSPGIYGAADNFQHLGQRHGIASPASIPSST